MVPCDQNKGHHHANAHGDVTTGRELRAVGNEERQVKNEQDARNPRQAPGPGIADGGVRNRGRGHGAGDRKAVGIGQVFASLEKQNQADGADGQEKIDAGKVNLPLSLGAGVLDGGARKETEIDRLPR